MTKDTTICAIATAPGGAIGIIRVSGKDAVSIADSIFSPFGTGHSLSDRKPYTIAFGNIVGEDGNVIDEVLVSVFRSPHSYTGEDSVEISCHGSAYILQQTISLLIRKGCCMAEPGEFTQRAFLNGKIDLSQAEAVADLISSTNRATHDMALSQLKGHFSNELSTLRSQLLKITSLLELELDFSDHEELEFANRDQLQRLAVHIKKHITSLISSFDTGNALRQGICVAIVGNTNVGKSTLLNRLVGEDKSIVSDIHGTTRDYIEGAVVLEGVLFRFVDTAGIRQTCDVVESIGIERTYQKISEARIVIWIVDSVPSDDEIKEMKERVKGKKLIVVYNKIDQAEHCKSCETLNSIATGHVGISAKCGTNITALIQLIVESANIPQLSESDVVVTSARHYNALTRAAESIQNVIDGMNIGLSSDIIAEDLRATIDSLADITGEGRISSQETLNNIFRNFCVGK